MSPLSAYFSQMGEDKYVDTEILHGMEHGVFLDIGAHDGKTFSNTYFFETFRNWTGICIEPLPDTFKKLKSNRKAIAINACVGSVKGKQEFLKVSGTDNAEMYSGLTASFDRRQLDTIQKEVKKRHGTLQKIMVPTFPLREILTKHKITHVDYCSLDTEGSELDVLRSIDFSAVDITCFTIEDLYGNPKLTEFMRTHGYDLKTKLDKDLVFVKKSADLKKKIIHQQGPQSVSLVIHTKNEAHNILECIRSAQAISDEVIVCDMESTDATVKLAKQAGARVIAAKDVGFADPARNLALRAATKDWIMVLDADERLTPKLCQTITKVIASGDCDVVSFPRKNLMLGKWIRHGIRWPDYQIRLFRRGFAHWTDTIHTAAQYTGRLYTLPAEEKHALVHHHSLSIRGLMDKTYLEASLERFYDDRKDLSPEDVHHRMEMDFPWRYFEHEGWKDGTHGLVVNKFMECYRFIEFALYWERTGYKEIAKPETLRELWDIESRLRQTTEELKIIKDSKFFVFWKLYVKMKSLIGR